MFVGCMKYLKLTVVQLVVFRISPCWEFRVQTLGLRYPVYILRRKLVHHAEGARRKGGVGGKGKGEQVVAEPHLQVSCCNSCWPVCRRGFRLSGMHVYHPISPLILPLSMYNVHQILFFLFLYFFSTYGQSFLLKNQNVYSILG